jgi:hypothetical protein
MFTIKMISISYKLNTLIDMILKPTRKQIMGKDALTSSGQDVKMRIVSS